jgi:hypothetical protein
MPRLGLVGSEIIAEMRSPGAARTPYGHFFVNAASIGWSRQGRVGDESR